MDDQLKKLNPSQQEAITFGPGPLLIVAGAGTGKTTVITQRLAWLIEEGLAKPNEILVLTFTEKAAEEMEERVDKLLPYGYLDLWISTFHSFGDRILRQHGLDIGLSNDFKVLTPTETWLLVRQNLDKFNLDYYRPLGNPAKFIHALLKHFSRCKDETISPEDYAKHVESSRLNTDNVFADETKAGEISRLTEIANGYHVYNQLLLDNNALDFGDLINYVLKLFQERPLILEKYRRQFKYILIDEFQDTNLAQYELIKLLAAPANNLTVVGDDDQSIYKFRGASISNILHFKNDFPQAKEALIAQNFRAKQNLLDLSYQLIKNNNPERLEIKLGLNKKLTAERTGEGEIEFLPARTAEEEAQKIVEKIIKISQNEKTNWNDFAILVRANSQAENFIQAFEAVGLPYQFLASTGLYQQPLIMDILAYLRLLDNYHENTALYRILNLPLWQLTTEEIIHLNHLARKKAWSLFETLKHAPAFACLPVPRLSMRVPRTRIGVGMALSPAGLKTAAQILALVEKHTALARQQSVGKVALAFLLDSGYLTYLTEREQHGAHEAARQILYLKKFFDTLAQFEKNHAEKQVKHYLEELNYVLASGDEGSLAGALEEGPEAIKIMTIHSAKGLEFRYVFLVNLIEQRFPAIERSEPIEIPAVLIKEIIPSGDIHLQEERRLFYVALTRARDGLFFSWAENYGGTRKRKPSRFLNELGLTQNVLPNPSTVPPFKTAIPQNNKKIAFKLPKHLSFTQLRAFETCPLQYKFAHLLQIPVKGRPSFSFGKTLHSALQKFYEKLINLNAQEQTALFSSIEKSELSELKAPTEEELLAFYDQSWIDDWYENKEQKQKFYEKGRQILKDFYKIHSQNNWPLPKYLENGFHLKIGEVIIKGQIDRIDCRPDGTVEVIDYKTGQPKKEEKLLPEDKEQLLIYQLAVKEVWQEIPSLLSFYYLDNQQKISFLGSAAEIQKLKEKIIRLAQEIKDSSFPPRPSEFICRFCDFKEICEFAKI